MLNGALSSPVGLSNGAWASVCRPIPLPQNPVSSFYINDDYTSAPPVPLFEDRCTFCTAKCHFVTIWVPCGEHPSLTHNFTTKYLFLHF